MSDTLQSADDNAKSAHLFVLIHGLWGGPNHMSTIERSIKELLPECSKEIIVTLKPSSFRFWKTYDGLKYNSQRIIQEIFYEIEILKQNKNYRVDKISIIGYSLGGLLSRYVIGMLNDLNVYSKIEPVFFTTFATPHVGIEFFKENVFDKGANHIGQFIFGKSGREMFMRDAKNIMVTLADPKETYYKGLAKFQKHILLANIKNDRTVAFFTSYITDYSPFDDWETIKIKYLKDLPQARIGNSQVQPKFVDLTRSHALEREESFPGNLQEETSFFRSNRIARTIIICSVAFFLLPFWIPMIFTSSLFASIYSMIKIRLLSAPNIDIHWKRVENSVYGSSPVDPEDARIGEKARDKRRKLSQYESFKGDTSGITENAMENIMYAEERFSGRTPQFRSHDEDRDDIQPIIEGREDSLSDTDAEHSGERDIILDKKEKKQFVNINTEGNDLAMKKHIKTLEVSDYSKFPLFKSRTKLPLGESKKFIIDSLNQLRWIKIPVYIDAWNSHDGIVARRGPRTNPKGAATIGLWCSILRDHMKQLDIETTGVHI
ncbi:uncharacterized protein PRCAT00000536001 [Priceomyces carsonii]|uniref:uncharacterized protein n=1 Tax=Priceomyces carsonii TaxID=28549 RepID=UPI002EDAEAED|nr:unnamed protein product [Priceomyces carsonii]